MQHALATRRHLASLGAELLHDKIRCLCLSSWAHNIAPPLLHIWPLSEPLDLPPSRDVTLGQ
eukprot:12933385-Prorocentrum_lima.AAC.1